MGTENISRILSNILKTPLSRNLFITCLVVSALFPFYNCFYIIPSFNMQLTVSTEDEAIRTASYLKDLIIKEKTELTKASFSNEDISEIKRLARNFQLEKLKIFSRQGEIIFSTTAKDIGETNKNDYFQNVVAKGKVYTMVVQQNAKSLEGRVVTADVVETYVPLLSNGAFTGALEIYYDITDRKEKQGNFLARIYAVQLAIILIFLITVIVVVCKASKNILAKERAEEALCRSEAKFRTLYDSTSDAVMLLDEKGYFDCNKAALAIFGCATREQFYMKDPAVLSPPQQPCGTDSRVLANQMTATAMEKGSLYFDWMHKRTDNGEIFPAKVLLTAMELDGKSFMQAIVRNISERKKIEAGLEKTRQELAVIKIAADEVSEFAENVINTVREPLIALDQDLRVVKVSHSFYQFFKVTPEETMGQLIYDLGNKQWDIPKLRELLETILPEKATFDNYEVEHDFTTIGRRTMLLNARQIQRVLGKERIILLAIEDITGHKRAEEEKAELESQNRQLQKAESLGRMAGAVAHTFNNQLAVVIGNLEMAIGDLPEGAGPVHSLTAAMQAAQKAAEVSGQMLTYLGQSFEKRELLDLSETCRQNLHILRAVIPGKVALEAYLTSPGPVVSANANQIQQVLANLVANAWEAVGENRSAIHLNVKTVSPAEIPASHRFPIGWQPRNDAYACLEMTDGGCGVQYKDIQKLFDPFFTTKFTGRGLGLSVVLGIVKAHGGAVTVESEPGLGSTFRVFFPVSAEEVPRPLDKTSQPMAIEGGGAVLLVDDEEMVREMAAAMLTRLGFTVLAARDGIEAIEVFLQHRNQIRLVLTDLTMPRMDGWEVLTALRKLAPDIPVIMASGYDKAQVMAGDHPELPQVFLGKPYKRRVLSDAIDQALVHSKQEEIEGKSS
jgi:PAS domain S-box-containing protein